MKKALTLLLALALILVSVFSFASCEKQNGTDATTLDTSAVPDSTGSDTVDDVTVNVGYLSGTTGLGLAKMIADHKDDAKRTFTKYNSPAEIMAAYAKGDVDFAALPTNAFPTFTKSVGNRAFQMFAINTLGVLYLLSDDGATIPANDLSSLSGKSVYVPENAPKLVLQHILNENGVENVDLNMKYNLETIDAGAQADADVHYVLLPEPKATALTSQTGTKTFTVALDLTAAWNEVDEDPLVQGCLIVSKDFANAHKATVDALVSEYEASINWMKDQANLDEAAQYAVDAGILPKVPLAKKAIPRCNLTFISGTEMMTAANAFFTALGLAVQPADAYYGAR
ncbi:MAG: ABC transporter substrate-binding protein [Clostridia bacterium]|nr:ABC transporter substrate-binding protein [Clostridia bacterium]